MVGARLSVDSALRDSGDCELGERLSWQEWRVEISAKCPSRDQDAEVGTLMLLPAGKGFGLVFWRDFWARERAVARTGIDLSLWSGTRLETTSKQGPSA